MVEDIELEDIELEDIDDENIENLDLDDFGEVEEKIDKPHFKVNTKEFNNYLRVAKNIAQMTGNDIISKSICMKVDGDYLKIFTTDLDVYLKYKLELLNVENVLKEHIVVPIEIIEKLINAAPTSTVIYKDDDNFKMKLVGGDMALETYNVDMEKFIFEDEIKREGSIESVKLYSIVKDLGSVASNAVSPKERRIICDNDGAFANFMWAIIQSENEFPEMDIKVKDIKVLQHLISNNDEELEIYNTVDSNVERKIIKGNNFEYAFLVSSIGVNEMLKDSIDEIVIDNGIYVDYIQLYKMIELAVELPYSLGKMELNYEEDKLKLIIKTKDKNKESVFKLPGSISGKIKPVEDNLIIQARLFRTLLKSFADSSSVKIGISEEGVGLYSDKYKAAVSSKI